MSAADAWFLYLEGPTVHLHVTGLLLLDPSTAPDGLSFDSLHSFIEGRLHLMPALRQRLVEVPMSIDHPTWIDDPDFEIDDHLHHRVMDAASADDLAELVGSFASTPLRRDQPLWDMAFIEGLDGGGVAVAMKMHHCIVDGVSGMEVMAELLDLEPIPSPRPAARDEHPAPVPSPVEAAMSASWNRLTDPLRPVRAAVGAATSMVNLGGSAVRRRLGGADAVAHPVNAPRTRFNASIGPQRQVAFGLAPLEDLKSIRAAFGVTVNDVVLAACSYGLRQYLQTWDELPDRPLVCSVPVSTHGHGADPAANQVSNMFVNLPVDIADPVEQLMSIHRGSLGAKEIQGSVGTHLISDIIELIPATLFQLTTRLYSASGLADRMAPVHNLIVSNVKGSPVPLYMAGAHVTAMFPFGPLMEGTGLNVTVLSNNGEMNIGLIACPDLVPSLDELLDEMIAGVAVLLDASRHAV